MNAGHGQSHGIFSCLGTSQHVSSGEETDSTVNMKRCAPIYDIQPVHPQDEHKHLDDSRLSQCDWSLLLKEDFTAALITLILHENKIPSDRENM